MPAIDQERVRAELQRGDFRRLFVEELGWSRFAGEAEAVTIDGAGYQLEPLAEKAGLGVYRCSPGADGRIPDSGLRRKIEHQVARRRREHLIIYTDRRQSAQLWQWVRRELGRPLATREVRYGPDENPQVLLRLLEPMAFSIAEEERGPTITDVTERLGGIFVERVTKRFYDRFTTEHKSFLSFVEGIAEQGDREWYASLMLNRLMFIYFIQKRGFLDGDVDYLRHKLELMRQRAGVDRFHTFYRYFLLRLFHEGLDQPEGERAAELQALLGTVPYLNGGLFDIHQLEQQYPEITIPDDAFGRIFAFFDAYQWQLDERPMRGENEINPDVLGYIFEKYINQKQMGAYYTKEDITEYIAKNTIIPYLFNSAEQACSIAFAPDSALWRLLRDDPDRYLYAAVRKGVDAPLPPEIAAGEQDVSKRGGWNRPINDERIALPTETWREFMARRALPGPAGQAGGG